MIIEKNYWRVWEKLSIAQVLLPMLQLLRTIFQFIIHLLQFTPTPIGFYKYIRDFRIDWNFTDGILNNFSDYLFY